MPEHTEKPGKEAQRCPPEYPKGLPASWLATVTNPILDSGYRRLVDGNGTQRVFAVTSERQCAIQTGEMLQREYLTLALMDLGYHPASAYVISTALEFWARTGERMDGDPEPFAFSNEDIYTFSKLLWMPRPTPYPAWEEFLERLSSEDTYSAFIGSCFDRHSTGRQFLWLYGPNGQDGKSFTLSTIMRLFGPAGCAITGESIRSSNQFTASAWYGKRVAVYADCKNPKLGMSEILRNITSGDSVPIEFKGKPAFTAAIRLKLLIASNSRPELTGGNADKSRLLLIEVAPSRKTDDPAWLGQLEEQMPGFIWHCLDTYKRLVPHHGNIPVPAIIQEQVDDAAACFEDEYTAAFADLFDLDEKSFLRAHTVRELLVQRSSQFHDGNRMGDWASWLERTHGIRRRRHSEGVRYIGLRLRASVTMPAPGMRTRAPRENGM
jgi:hypothetical protein